MSDILRQIEAYRTDTADHTAGELLEMAAARIREQDAILNEMEPFPLRWRWRYRTPRHWYAEAAPAGFHIRVEAKRDHWFFAVENHHTDTKFSGTAPTEEVAKKLAGALIAPYIAYINESIAKARELVAAGATPGGNPWKLIDELKESHAGIAWAFNHTESLADDLCRMNEGGHAC